MISFAKKKVHIVGEIRYSTGMVLVLPNEAEKQVRSIEYSTHPE
jgi:hypothetical protein